MTNPEKIVITDVQIPFVSMVTLLLKLALAVIPAAVLLAVIIGMAYAGFGALDSAMASIKRINVGNLLVFFCIAGGLVALATMPKRANQSKPFMAWFIVGWITVTSFASAYALGYVLYWPF